MRQCRIALALAIALASLWTAASAGPAVAQGDQGAYAGWVIDAYPDMSSDAMVAALTRMRDAGANLAWIGHNNPVDVDPNAKEVALSYAVYAAFVDPSDPRNAAAQSIVAAQVRMLDAARGVGLKVVLPISYRTQMGAAWNATHQASLRRGPDGAILNFDGPDAAPYAGDFRDAMQRYYEWVDQQFVTPYRDVILMVMVANEPTGVDYSTSADGAFFQQFGYHFADVGADQQRATQLGYFQSHVMVDFAVWAARQWLAIDPSVTVTLAFDGEPARQNEQAPALEDIFRLAPPNFQPAWDTNLRNGTPADSLDDSEVTKLDLLYGTLGHFSAKYRRPYWLWSSGNSWGLGQGSGDPGTIDDALVNLRMAADVSRQAGGMLRGIAVWAYNVRGQGLYNDAITPSYDRDALFARVSATLPMARRIMVGAAGPGPDVLIVAPYVMADRIIGQRRLVDIWSFIGYSFGDMVSLARSGATIAVVDSLDGEDLTNTRMLVVLAREPSDLAPRDVAAIQRFRASGRPLVDSQRIEDNFKFGAAWVAPGNSPEGLFSVAFTKEQVGPTRDLGLPRLVNSFVFTGPAELVVYGGTSTDAPGLMQAWVNLPYRAAVTSYSGGGDQAAGPGIAAVATRRHELAVVALRPAAPPLAHDARYFAATGYRVDDDVIWNYVSRRGGLRTFGYPTSRTMTFLGFRTQFFQRAVVQVTPQGTPRTLNLLDSGQTLPLLPYASFNRSTFPLADPALVAGAPPPSSARYAKDAVAWVQQNAPDQWNGLPVNFGATFSRTVTLADAFPDGGGDPALLPLLNLELWGLPTSAPAYDPNNHNFVYQRFQRGIMHYDAGCSCTQGILLADYLKAILLNRDVPDDLAAEAAVSTLLGQYDPRAPRWVGRPGSLAGTDLTNAFEPG